MSRLLKIVRLFGRISSLLQVSFAKETYNFKELTNRSHPIIIVYSSVYKSLEIYLYLYGEHISHVCVCKHAARMCVQACSTVFVLCFERYTYTSTLFSPDKFKQKLGFFFCISSFWVETARIFDNPNTPKFGFFLSDPILCLMCFKEISIFGRRRLEIRGECVVVYLAFFLSDPFLSLALPPNSLLSVALPRTSSSFHFSSAPPYLLTLSCSLPSTPFLFSLSLPPLCFLGTPSSPSLSLPST